MSDIKPALTAAEWARFPSWGHSPEPKPGEEPLYHRTRHGIAAANLHEQPFGFTRKDVQMLRAVAVHHAKIRHDGVDHYVARSTTDLAQRIDALLPPEE